MSIKDELEQVEADLARLRAENQEIRDQIRDIGATRHSCHSHPDLA